MFMQTSVTVNIYFIHVNCSIVLSRSSCLWTGEGIPWVCILNRGHMSRNMGKTGPREYWHKLACTVTEARSLGT